MDQPAVPMKIRPLDMAIPRILPRGTSTVRTAMAFEGGIV